MYIKVLVSNVRCAVDARMYYKRFCCKMAERVSVLCTSRIATYLYISIRLLFHRTLVCNRAWSAWFLCLLKFHVNWMTVLSHRIFSFLSNWQTNSFPLGYLNTFGNWTLTWPLAGVWRDNPLEELLTYKVEYYTWNTKTKNTSNAIHFWYENTSKVNKQSIAFKRGFTKLMRLYLQRRKNLMWAA